MQTILELHTKRTYLYKSLVFLKDDIQELVKCPCETVCAQDLVSRYEFIVREIKELDDKIKNILMSQIEITKLDLKNLQTQLSFVEKPYHVDDLPTYSQIFK